jgi:GxxExxY protein
VIPDFSEDRGGKTMKEPAEVYDVLANRVIGAAIEVHRHLGPGYLESVYEEAMCVELTLREISFERQMRFVLNYKGHEIGGKD